MSKKNAKVKYYAIKEGKDTKDLIVMSWDKCKELVYGYNAVYKSFSTKEEAENYLKNVDTKKVKEQAIYGMEERKAKKENTRTLNLRISKELYREFESKCIEENLNKNKVLELLIDEWIY